MSHAAIDDCLASMRERAATRLWEIFMFWSDLKFSKSEKTLSVCLHAAYASLLYTDLWYRASDGWLFYWPYTRPGAVLQSPSTECLLISGAGHFCDSLLMHYFQLDFVFSSTHTVIRSLWVSAKFGICTVESVNGTLIEDKMRRFKDECTHFIFKKCPIYTYDGASAKFITNSHETDNSAEHFLGWENSWDVCCSSCC